jgi:hypothetical protein
MLMGHSSFATAERAHQQATREKFGASARAATCAARWAVVSWRRRPERQPPQETAPVPGGR